MHREIVQGKKVWFFDLDGTMYFDHVIAPGAIEIVQRLRAAERSVRFITNNSRHSGVRIAGKLQGMGLDVAASDIIAVTDYVGRYMLDRYGCLRTKVAGSAELIASITSFGHEVVSYDAYTAADAVIVGLDVAFDYDKLRALSAAIGQGSLFIAANADRSHPGEDGVRNPETGAWIAALEAVTGIHAEFVGKPEPHLFAYGMADCGARPGECVMVGDNFDTDIVGGKAVGMYTVWLRGQSADDQTQVGADHSCADWIVAHLPELNRRMEE